MSCPHCGEFDDYLANFECEMGDLINEHVKDPTTHKILMDRLMMYCNEPKHICQKI